MDERDGQQEASEAPAEALACGLELRISTAELRLKEAEYELKQQQIEAQRLAATRKPFELSTTAVTLLCAAIGLGGTAVGALFQGFANLRLEQTKFEATSRLERQRLEAGLVLQAVSTGDVEKAKVNLMFLINAGYVSDPQGKIAALAENKEGPVLPSRREESIFSSEAEVSSVYQLLSSKGALSAEQIASALKLPLNRVASDLIFMIGAGTVRPVPTYPSRFELDKPAGGQPKN